MNLEKSIAEIDRTLEGFGGGQRPGKRRGRGRRPKAGRVRRAKKSVGKRGALKTKVINALKAAGKNGLHVKDLAKKLKAKEPNLRVWFYSTGKKIKNIKQTKPATYAWVN